MFLWKMWNKNLPLFLRKFPSRRQFRLWKVFPPCGKGKREGREREQERRKRQKKREDISSLSFS